MKSVRIEFAGPQSEAMARRFFSYLVDGGLEDHLIQNLSGAGATLEITDSHAGDLTVLFQCREGQEATGKPPKTRRLRAL